MSDPRFAALSNDPRYRLPSRKEARTAVDPRFNTLFTDQEFRKKASVDRYGRRILAESKKKDLERLYRLDRVKQKPASKTKVERQVDESSEESEEEDDEESEQEQIIQKRDPARQGGFLESESSEEETSDEGESDEEAELAEETAGQEQSENIPVGDVSRRIACVNLDWDNIRAADIMAVARSFAPQSGKVQNVRIYPSEFGRERLEREEIEGPPKEIFASSGRKADEEEDVDEDDESSDDDEKIKNRLLQNQASEGEEFDSAKLRQYQLDRLRYYYAVISCDNASTARALYDSMDGREYLSSSNFFDLRFVPDETSFDDDKPHDECHSLPQGYKPNDFRTEALTHSKVRLTWDDDDATRKEVQKRAFSQAEMDENDVQTYLASDNSDADSISSRKSAVENHKAKKKEAQRVKMREALGLSAEPTKSSKKDNDEVLGDMQITFTSGLTGDSSKGVFENEPQDEESTRDRYIRKERERKQKRKEKVKKSSQPDEDGDEEQDHATKAGATKDDEADDPWNDPFFNDPELATKQAKATKAAARKVKLDAKAAADAEAESRRAELELLMADDNGENGAGIRHFDERELEKARKAAKRKGKGKNKNNKAAADEVLQQDGFELNTGDARFAAMFDSHEYAIDPTHARFKDTDATKALREQQRKKRKHVAEDVGLDELPVERNVKKTRKADNQGDHDDVKALAARLKKKGKSERWL